MRIAFAPIVGLVLFLSANLQADFVVAVTAGSTTYNPNPIASAVAGNEVTLSVWLYDSAPAQRKITGYQLAFDIGQSAHQLPGSTTNDGLGYNGSFTNFSFTYHNLTNNTTNLIPDPDAIDYDLRVSTNQSALTELFASNSINGPTKLFDVTFKSSASTQPGYYNFRFAPAGELDTGIATESANFLIGATDNFVALGGQFQITAVPEPSSLALVGLVSVGACFARRRRASV